MSVQRLRKEERYERIISELRASPTVRISELAGCLPSDTPKIDVAMRQAEIRSRKGHLAWRFRT